MPAFRYRTAVRFADVDHAGIVYYPVFFHYFHVAFEEFFRERMGARAYVDLLDRQRIGFPSVRATCEYKAPLSFGDAIDVEMSIARLGNRSVSFQFRVYRIHEAVADQPADDRTRRTRGPVDRTRRTSGPVDGSSPADPPGAGGPGAGPPQPNRVLAAEGTNVCAVVDLEAFRAISLPPALRALFETLG